MGDTVQICGKVGLDVDLSDAQLAASISTMRALAILKQHYGTLDVIGKVLQMNVFVHSTSSLYSKAKLLDGASEILYEILGLDTGRHTRTSVSVYQLPKMHLLKSTSFCFEIKVSWWNSIIAILLGILFVRAARRST